MLADLKRFLLIMLLLLTGYAAVMLASGVYRANSPEALPWAFQGAMVIGFLLLVYFAAFSALERRAWRMLALLGLSIAALMLVAVPLFVAWDMQERIFANTASGTRLVIGQILQTGTLTAGLFCLVPFAMLPRMQRVGKILQWTTVTYLAAAYLTLLLKLWQVDGHRIEEPLATLLIPAGVCMMGVFAMDKFLGIRRPDVYSAVAPAVMLRCPRCHNHQTLGYGESRCTHCRLLISIEVEEPKCPNCSFNLHGLTNPKCPECGLALSDDDCGNAPASEFKL